MADGGGVSCAALVRAGAPLGRGPGGCVVLCAVLTGVVSGDIYRWETPGGLLVFVCGACVGVVPVNTAAWGVLPVRVEECFAVCMCLLFASMCGWVCVCVLRESPNPRASEQLSRLLQHLAAPASALCGWKGVNSLSLSLGATTSKTGGPETGGAKPQ